ncbi:hypothetical protein Pint_26368 [Pistacia integerrima]|uniref:Uncharacterized protein n=1 Tax=Pistacia integerrima TaxID=434235 RepID=A0ACC0YEZ5_9ROSI|nr:hypothetical protein Pint_26368 [Pistacia integerrima]
MFHLPEGSRLWKQFTSEVRVLEMRIRNQTLFLTRKSSFKTRLELIQFNQNSPRTPMCEIAAR